MRLRIGDSAGAWVAAGFAPEVDLRKIGDVRLRLYGRGAGRGITSWSLRDISH